MGVTGLWRLIEPAGKPVPVETLENKVLAVDISIWLHQMVKGYQDAKGAPIANAHLMGLFQRLCKLLYFRIKPIFVFDGAFPELKRETIAKRQDNKAKYNSESERLKREIALLLSKKTAIGSLLGKQISPKKAAAPVQNDDDDIFKLPALPQKDETESESEDEESSSSSTVDVHSIDVESDNFKNLPPKEKYDLLIELKETRKMNSWGRLHELPKKSDSFSDFQMQRLLKRRKIQECLEETEKEIGDTGMSMNELESLLNEEGIDTKIESIPTKRIASNNTTRFLLINDVKQALAEAKKKQEIQEAGCSKNVEITNQNDVKTPKKDELEEDLQKAIKMSLESNNEVDTSACASKTDDSWTSYYSDFEYSTDSEENDGAEPPDMSSAKAYIMQYSDFTVKAIDEIVSKKDKIKKAKKPVLNEIIEEINNEKSVIVDNVDLSSDEGEKVGETNNEKKQKSETLIDESVSENAHFEITQSSVVIIDNEVQDVIHLESSLEENLEKSQNSKENRYESKEAVTSKIEAASESDSSDNDFEDVPDIDQNSKTVVQLTLNNISDAPEDDIFADVFENKKEIEKKIIPHIKEEKHEVPKINEIIQVDEDDEELQKAIQMSLECVADETTDNLTSAKEVISPNDKKSDVQQPLNNPGPRIKEPSIELQSSDNTHPSSNELDKLASTQSDEFTPSTAKETSPQKQTVSKEKLNDMIDEINTEEQCLMQEQGRLERVGRNITEQMTKDAQELLQLFGIPYIVAPMEAEAQCAFLESVNLTDGTITDDSDIWLFGGRTVYKNFFNQKKHVLQFLADRIERSFNLNREQLVLLALLVGSDYTTGVAGVGPVTALEILASFPFNKRKLNEAVKQERYAQMIAGLQEFKQWVRSGKRTDNISLKKKLRNVALTDDFPSVRVVQAYLEPNVEKSEERFTWGEIDVAILRDYTRAKFGWSQHKLDEIIKPVLKRLTERKSQKSVQDYFKRKVAFQSLEDQMSKRVKAAVQKMGPEETIEQASETLEEKTKPERKRKVTGKSKSTEPGPSKSKLKKSEETILTDHSVRVVSEVKDGKSALDIQIRKTDRYQEIIPQREKDKQSLLQNKMKAIEVFRKTNIDKKKKLTKRKAIVPKADAGLSESDSD